MTAVLTAAILATPALIIIFAQRNKINHLESQLEREKKEKDYFKKAALNQFQK